MPETGAEAGSTPRSAGVFGTAGASTWDSGVFSSLFWPMRGRRMAIFFWDSAASWESGLRRTTSL